MHQSPLHGPNKHALFNTVPRILLRKRLEIIIGRREQVNKLKMVWSRNDTLSLIEHIKSMKVLKLLDGKAVRNAHVYHSLSKQIPGMTATQVQNKWKKLKSRYLKERAETSKSGEL